MRRRFYMMSFVLALGLSGCGLNSTKGSGNIISEARSVQDFTSVELSGSGTIVIEQSDAESLTITTDDNLLPYLTSEVVGSRLKLGTKDGKNIDPSKDVTYKLLVKRLNGIVIAGGGDVDAKGLLTDSLSVDIAGAGDVRLSGETTEQKVSISGAGDYNAENFKSKNSSITITGAGDVLVAASDSLDVRIVGAGDVRYVGDPKVTKEIVGAGSVEKK
jgi:hypothetical protein